MNLIFILIVLSPFIAYQIYFNRVVSKKVPPKRKQKIFELLKNKFGNVTENNLGFFENSLNNNNILFEYRIDSYKWRFTNYLTIYFEITNIEEDIKKLCKIHFNCSTINNRVFVKKPVDLLFSNSLSSLVNYSEKTINTLISETEYYISQKRAERDKNLKQIS